MLFFVMKPTYEAEPINWISSDSSENKIEAIQYFFESQIMDWVDLIFEMLYKSDGGCHHANSLPNQFF